MSKDQPKFDGGKGPLRFRGTVYERLVDNTWRRYLLRRYADGTVYWSPTIKVREDVLFCLGCLSNHVMLDFSEQEVGARPRYRCGSCGLLFSILPP